MIIFNNILDFPYYLCDVFILISICVLSVIIPQKIYYSIAVLTTLYIYLKQYKNIQITSWLKWKGLIIISLIINLTFSVNYNLTLSFIQSYIIRIIIIYAILLKISSFQDIERCFKCIIFVSIISIVYTTVNENFSIYSSNFGKKTFKSTIAFTYILIPSLILTIYYFKKNLYYKITFVLLLISNILTTSRKALLLPLLYILTYNFQQNKKRGLKLIKQILLIIFVLIIFYKYILKSDWLNAEIKYRIESFVSYFTDKNIEDKSLNNRLYLIDSGIQYIKNKPIIGYGFNTYSYMTGHIVYSHNNYIETLFGGGIIFLFLFYYFPIYCIYRMHFYNESLAWLLSSFLIVYLYSDVGCVSYFIYPQEIIVALADMFLYIKNKEIRNMNSI